MSPRVPLRRSVGLGKGTAAQALACALICHDSGCGACGECTASAAASIPTSTSSRPRARRATSWSRSATSSATSSLAPIEGGHKVYIFKSADMFNAASRQRVPQDARGAACDVTSSSWPHSRRGDRHHRDALPGRALPAHPRGPRGGAARARKSAPRDEATAALAAAGGVVARAPRLPREPSPPRSARCDPAHPQGPAVWPTARRPGRSQRAARRVKAPLEDVKAAQSAESRARGLPRQGGGSKALEERHKRELTAREREGLLEVLNVAESWLRDCLVLSQGCRRSGGQHRRDGRHDRAGAVITPAAAVTRAGRRERGSPPYLV